MTVSVKDVLMKWEKAVEEEVVVVCEGLDAFIIDHAVRLVAGERQFYCSEVLRDETIKRVIAIYTEPEMGWSLHWQDPTTKILIVSDCEKGCGFWVNVAETERNERVFAEIIMAPKG